MLKYLALAAALLASPATYAADTITVQIVSDVPGATGTLTGTITFTQGDMATFLTALQAATSTATPSAAASAWFQSLKAEFVRLATQYQTQQAIGAITPIAPN